MKNIKYLLLISIFIIIPACELSIGDDSMAEIISEKKLLDMVNELRSQGCDCGTTSMPPVKELSWDYQLERAAISHSIDMKEQNYFSHVSIDGASFADRINGTDYKGSPGGENIAAGYGSEEQVFNGWRNSPGHCQNMMNGGFTDIAVGRSGNYWTMVFGRQ